MKMAAALAALAIGLLAAAPADAYPVSVGDQIVKLNSGPLGGGGEIAVENMTAGTSFQTFCLEREEIVLEWYDNPYRVYDISDFARSGGGGAVDGKDELSSGTKWLFYNFWTGTLKSGYGYKQGNRKKGEGALQLAIWYLEGETDSLTEYDGDEDKTYDGTYFYDLALGHAEEGAYLPVKAMNIWGPLREDTEPGEGQSMLVVVTPEPLTILLIGSALVGLAALRRRG